ncbi:hypothetical protein PACTADRAFT_49538 [Pachysolen tannophilus NRRL Y-2460]|uniref:Bms1-type G domain-containing protein n=1 Tax=Pachysolen tannophilus NRRL Y-2460 TaxID=669874 RepID=A0A1E4TWM2_PACTA|nr:hypothetical protein PACTADRAFT_49538 [Pachysolen tannophilus NRRL Y-2460]
MAGHSHRSTLKNNHKPFKSRHASKSALKNQYKGKVEKDNSLKTNKKLKTISKFDRKNFNNQLKKNKILASSLERKIFNGPSGVEKIVTIIALTNDISCIDIAEKLINSCKDNDDEIQEILKFQVPSVRSVKINRFKSNLKIIIPDDSNFISLLDACKISDFVIFGLSASQEVDPKIGEQLLRAIELQGISSVLGVVPNAISAYPNRKNLQADALRSLSLYFNHFFPDQEKLYNLENPSDCINATSLLCRKFPKSVTWRDLRGYMLANSVEWVPSLENNNVEGYMAVEGVVRGVGFTANRLIHIPGYGDFQIDHIEKIPTRYHRNNKLDVEMVDESENKFFPNINQENLDELAPLEYNMSDDELENDINGDKLDEKSIRRGAKDQNIDDFNIKKRIPKGMSEYQSRWFLEDELEELVDEVGAEEELQEISKQKLKQVNGDDDDEDDDDDEMSVEGEYDNQEMDNEGEIEPSEMFVDLSPEEERRQLELFKQREHDDLEFPDEIELSPSESAIERLQRYRGIKSLASCEWDCDEQDSGKQPSEWLRLLRIKNFKATKNKIIKQAITEAQVVAGDKVRIFIKVPFFILEKIGNPLQQPFIIYGLLEHEHKLAVSNFSIQTWEDYDKPIPSKDSIIVQYGPRRQLIQPVFGSNSNNKNNVHKYSRFLHENSLEIATCIAPVTFTNSPAIFFKQSAETGKIELLGSGTFLNCDHTRVLAKRIVLTGEPFKIHKKVVTVRYMFFNPEDINHFKSIPLFTKMGRAGFIRESLGTHGYFKATFDNKLNAQDTIAMALYKRVWPKPSIMWSG